MPYIKSQDMFTGIRDTSYNFGLKMTLKNVGIEIMNFKNVC